MATNIELGIPGNLREAISIVRKTGELPRIYAQRDMTSGSSFSYALGVEIGNHKVPVFRGDRIANGDGHDVDALYCFVTELHERGHGLAAQLCDVEGISVMCGDVFYLAENNGRAAH